MNTDDRNCRQVTRFLVSPLTAQQPGFILQPTTVIQTIPVSVGSLLLNATNTLHNIVPTQPHHPINVFQELRTDNEKVSTKGRRPKHIELDIYQGTGNGQFADRPMCRSCGKHFMSRQQLTQHMLVHTDVRKYKCNYCERTFKQPSHLHQHHRIHTGEKPYKCPVPDCFRAFPQQSNLNHHLRNHDKPAPPPENTCSLCMRTYASETVLRSHISKIHMCDPDALLGFRKEVRNGNVPWTPNVEKSASANSVEGAVLQTTNSNTGFQKQTNLDESYKPVFVAKQDPLIKTGEYQPDFSTNSGNSAHDFELVSDHINISDDSRKTEILQNNISSHIDTNHGLPTVSDDSNYVKLSYDDEEEKIFSETTVTTEINFSVANCGLPERHDETVVQTGRSRKRKAFQPQRIIKYPHVNDEQ